MIRLYCDQYTFSESGEGSITFYLAAGQDKAHRSYLILSGLNTSYFIGFIGSLDASGASTALFNHPRPFPSGHVGEYLYFAFFLDAPWDFASNPVAIEIMP